MEKNSNIAEWGYNRVFDYTLEIDGTPDVQAESKERIRLRTTQAINAVFKPGHIPPRYTWVNDIQKILLVKTRHKEMVYLHHRGEFEPAGSDEFLDFSGLDLKRISKFLSMLRMGEGVICDLHPYDRGITFSEGFSVFVKDDRPGAILLPDNIVLQIATRVFVK